MQRMGCSEFEKRTIFLEDHACLSDKDYGTPCTCTDLIADGDSCGVDRNHVHEEARQRQDVTAPDQHIEFMNLSARHISYTKTSLSLL